MATQSEVEVDGLQIAYERAGEGPPLVLLHGYVGDGAGSWRRQLRELSDEFTVVAWDAPGAGRSSDPPESFRIADYADTLARFVETLGLARPHVVGLSFGGILALELQRRHPRIARSLVLASATAGWAGSLAPEVTEERLRQAVDLADLPSDQFVETLAPTMFSDSAPADLVDRFVESMRGFHPSGFRTMARSSAEADLRDALPGVDVPTLLIYGERDERAPLEVADHIHAAIPHSRLVLLPGVGHLCNLEAPGEFNSELRSFLRSAQDGRPN
jgi:pimeloyl-ACP methyl ester carboxylesterase